WLSESPISYQVQFAGFSLTSKLYDIDVPGYKTERKNRLRLFDVASVDGNIVYDGIDFDQEDIFRNLTLFLYPDDSKDQGKI
ncbi:glycogen/starch/alpha-glucan phosphorylase, partial [Streptococcus pyogenes]